MARTKKYTDAQLKVLLSHGVSTISSANVDEAKMFSAFKKPGEFIEAGELGRITFGISGQGSTVQKQLKDARNKLRKATLAIMEQIAQGKRATPAKALIRANGGYTLMVCKTTKEAEDLVEIM